MNASQTASLARWLVNAISGGIIAYTATKSTAAQGVAAFLANLITGPDVIAALMLGITWLWGHITHASDSPTTKTPGGGATVALLLVAGLLFTGCADFRVSQRDKDLAGRETTTEIHAFALFSSAQSLTKIKTSTTEKTQSFGGEGIQQQGATNTVAALNAIARIVEALPKQP